jgi:hypothetical protein
VGRHSSGERRSRLETTGAEVGGARHDLRVLLGTRRILLASVVAIVVILAGYFGVLAALGRVHDWLILLVIPAGLAGVSVGALLDHALRDPKPPADNTPDPAEPDSAGAGS